MKKLLFIMIMLAPMVVVGKKKVKYRPVYDYYVTSPQNLKSKSFEDSCVRFTFEWYEYKNYCISVEIRNKTNSRIYVEWENVRIDNGSICFKTDTYANYMDPKPDEVIHAKGYTRKELLERDNVGYDIKFFRTSFLRVPGDKTTNTLIIPIRVGDNVYDYKIDVSLFLERLIPK